MFYFIFNFKISCLEKIDALGGRGDCCSNWRLRNCGKSDDDPGPVPLPRQDLLPKPPHCPRGLRHNLPCVRRRKLLRPGLRHEELGLQPLVPSFHSPLQVTPVMKYPLSLKESKFSCVLVTSV